MNDSSLCLSGHLGITGAHALVVGGVEDMCEEDLQIEKGEYKQCKQQKKINRV